MAAPSRYHVPMPFQRYGTFAGGIDLPDMKRETLAAKIEGNPLPRRLLVPLAPADAPPATAVVDAGDRVSAGQRIGAGGDGGVDVFAPLAGTVAGRATARLAGWGGFVEVPAVELTDLADEAGAFAGGGDGCSPAGADGRGGDGADPDQPFHWRAASNAALADRLAAGMLVTARRPMPLAAWVERARRLECRTLLCNVMEHEPYVTSDHRLLAERGAEVIEALAALRRLVGARTAQLVADRRRVLHYEDSFDAAGRFDVHLVALPHKYPMGTDAILTKVLARREPPPGRNVMAVGVAVTDAATCAALYDWLVRGRRPVGRVVTVAGPRAERPRNVRAPCGTPCDELLPGGKVFAVHGGPMTGLPCCDGAVVGPATPAVLALDPPHPPIPSPCLRCGWCTDHCPARLNVADLNDAFELSLVARAEQSGAMACVECGTCSYVCPARLPLAQRVKQLKHRIVALRRAAAAGRGGDS